MKSKRNTSIFIVGVFFFYMLLCSACSPSHVLHTQEQAGRDYTYVHFAGNQEPFEITGHVDGEHIKTVKILGFEGDKFLIEFSSTLGPVKFSIKGPGTKYQPITPYSGTILIRDLDAIAMVETWARPSADYTLKITPLKIR